MATAITHCFMKSRETSNTDFARLGILKLDVKTQLWTMFLSET